MLFKNLKSGNLIEAKESSVIEMMKGSPLYEAVEARSEVPAPEEPKPLKKTTAKGGKSTK